MTRSKAWPQSHKTWLLTTVAWFALPMTPILMLEPPSARFWLDIYSELFP